MKNPPLPTKHYVLAWLMWLCAALFYFYEFALQVSPNVMKPELMSDFQLSAAALGALGSSYFISYAAMQIPVGMMIDRFGPRLLLTFASLVCALSCYLFAQTHSFFLAQLSRAMIGFGAAFALVSCFKVTTNWFPARYFALVAGLVITIGMLGAVFGEAPLALLVERFDWRRTMELFGIAGLILAIIIYLVVRDKPDYPINQNDLQATASKHLPVMQGLRKVFGNTQIWILSIYGGLMFAPTAALSATWGVAFLVEDYHLTRPVAASIISFLFIGWAVGCPLVGWISDRIGLRKLPMVTGSMLSLCLIGYILYGPPPSALLGGILFFLFGLCSSGFFLAFTIVREITPMSYNATALGFVNTLNSLGGAIFPHLIGTLLDYLWDPTSLYNGERLYTAHEYQIALGALPLSISIAIILTRYIQETHCRSLHE